MTHPLGGRFALAALACALVAVGCEQPAPVDQILDNTPAVCDDFCTEYARCELGDVRGDEREQAESDATDACRALCYWAVDRGVYAVTELDDDRYVDEKVEGDVVEEYLTCLYDARLYRCRYDSYGMEDGYDMSESDCYEVDRCLALLGIDARADMDGRECVMRGREYLWPDILSIYREDD